MSSCYQEGQSHPSDMSGSLSPAPNTVLSLFILHAPCQHQVMFSIFFRQICLAPMGGRAPLTLFRPFLLCFHLVQGSRGGFAAFFRRWYSRIVKANTGYVEKKNNDGQSLPRVGKVASGASRIGLWRYER